MRTGLITKKVGMSRMLNPETGVHTPVTLLQLDNCQVIGVNKADSDGRTSLQLGAFDQRASRINKARIGFFAKSRVSPKAKIKEFRVTEENLLEVGQELAVNHFGVGALVDVTAISKGKGFAGVMKRYNFSGLRASHGVSVSHRSHGSTGQCQDPGRVFKGKKMAGQMGNKRVTVQNLTICGFDEELGLIIVKGAVPGSKNSIVLIKDAVKKPLPKDVILPAALVSKADNAKKEDNVGDIVSEETAPDVAVSSDVSSSDVASNVPDNTGSSADEVKSTDSDKSDKS